VAEERDFGSAETINELFLDLLKITPFSKDEMEVYSQFLNDRNLLVHHGGVFTLKYLSQSTDAIVDIEHGSHYRSLEVTHEGLIDWVEFLLKIADKISSAPQKALL